MSKDPYKIVDSKPSWSSKLGSGIVALGSVATAIVITVPGLPGYQLLSEANAVLIDANPIKALSPLGDNSVPGTIQSTNQTIGRTRTGNTVLTGSANSTQAPVSGNQTTNGQISEQLTLPGVPSGNTTSPTPGSWSGSGSNANAGGSTASGNTTSPTPSSSGGSNANNNGGGNTSSGNTTSPTPGGGASEYEEDEDDEYEHEGEDEDDD